VQLRAVIAASLGSVTFTACGSSSPVEVIVEPGISAIEQSSVLACQNDRASMQSAVENFTLFNVGPPSAESDLVPDWLRSESQLHDLVDGAVVPAAGSGCDEAPADAAGATATTTAPPEPSNLRECTVDYKTLQVAIEAYYAMNGDAMTATEQALFDGALLRGLSEAFDVDTAGQIVAVPGGICDGVDVGAVAAPTGPSPVPVDLAECDVQRRTLEVAMEWYFETNGSPAADESVLVSADVLRSDLGGYDIVDGAIVPAPGSICPAL
jgi:hypothetical protein